MANPIWDPEHETMPRQKRKRLQLARLGETLQRVASKVPFYRNLFAQRGIDPRRIRSLEDLALLPLTTKGDLQNEYPYGMFAVPFQEMVRIHSSSGTKGKPTPVGYTKKDLEMWAENVARIVVAAGVTTEDVVQLSFSYGLFTGGLGLHYGLERVGCAVIPVASGNTPRQLLVMQDLGSTVLVCTPSYALYLAEAVKQESVLGRLHLRLGLFGAEPWSEGVRQKIEEGLGLAAYDNYGLSEVLGPGVSGECLERNGLHINEDHFLPEIIDPQSEEPRGYGEEGELVITTLSKEALPLIRYRTRDITRLYPEACPCGRTTLRMARVAGRSDDMLIIRGVNIYPSQIEHVLTQIPGVEPHYQLLVTRDGSLDALEVQVEVQAPSSEHETWAKGIEEKLRGVLGLRTKVTVLQVGSLARSEGKAKRVIDKR